MVYVFLLVAGIVFTALTALVFSVLTLVLGKLSGEFEVSGPEGWTFFDFYKRYLIIAAVFIFVSIPVGTPFVGIPALAVAYKHVFNAGWVQAAVIGTVGGFIATILFLLMMYAVLLPLGLT